VREGSREKREREKEMASTALAPLTYTREELIADPKRIDDEGYLKTYFTKLELSVRGKDPKVTVEVMEENLRTVSRPLLLLLLLLLLLPPFYQRPFLTSLLLCFQALEDFGKTKFSEALFRSGLLKFVTTLVERTYTSIEWVEDVGSPLLSFSFHTHSLFSLSLV
jgi:hypothetical protein